jgi:hypothetical protein
MQLMEPGTATALPELRNIHFDIAPPEPSTTTEALPSHKPIARELRARRVKMSPNEHFAAKVQEHGQPLHFPKSVIALILQKQKSIEITKNGIHFDYLKTKYTYWHQDSTTCANKIGQKALVTFDPDDMNFIHVLTPDGRYVESIPQKNKIEWFDDVALREEQKAKKASLSRDIERFREIHGPTSDEKANRVLTNAEKMQIVNTFPAEQKVRSAEAETPVPHRGGAHRPGERFKMPVSFNQEPETRNVSPTDSPAFPRAAEIHGALDILRRKRAEAGEKKEALKAFQPADLLAEDDTSAWDEGTGRRARPRFSAEKLLA